MTANLDIPFTIHGASRFAARIKRLSYLRALLSVGEIDQRGRVRVSAQELNSLVAESRSAHDYDAAKQLEKIRNLVAVCGRRSALITIYRDYAGHYRDPREQRRCLRRAEADRRRQVGR